MTTHRFPCFPLFVGLGIGIWLLTACQPVTFAASPQNTSTPPTLITQTPDKPAGELPADIALDYSSVAKGVSMETVPAQPASAGGPYWEAVPQHRRLVLQDYPITDHKFEPQIFIYPADELAATNEGAGKIAAALHALLETQQAGDELPFLPLLNELQVMHAQVQFLDFKNGSGVRFLTQHGQGPVPINNYELIYTFQGLTDDGRYYVSVILPITNPELSEGSAINEQETGPPSKFQDYISRTVALLERQDAGSFTPDLDTLDALIRSIDIN